MESLLKDFEIKVDERLRNIEYGQSPVGHVIDNFVYLGQVDKGLGWQKEYVVTRSDSFKVSRMILRHFIRCYGSDDNLPFNLSKIELLLDQFEKGELVL